MKLVLNTLAILVSIATAAMAQTAGGYRIEGQVRGLRDSTLTLGHYFGHNQYIPKAKARLDSSGRLVFTGDQPLPGGLYMVMLPNRRGKLELVLNGRENQFSFTTDTLNLVGNMRVTGSAENTAFYAYQQQMQTYGNELRALELQLQFRKDQMTALKLRREVAELQAKARTWQSQYIAQTDSLLMAKFLRATTEPELPKPPKRADGKPDTAYLYQYYKNHFWDTFDFADDRLVRTPIFQRKIDQYLQQMTTPTVDSLTLAADLIVNKARANKEVLSYAIWYITSQYERPRVMGTDGVFVHMAETYYLGGQMPVVDSTTLAGISRRLGIVKPLLVGKPFPTLSVSDTLRQPIDLNKVKADYTVLFFYDPTCAHCREAMPKLKQFSADTLASRGVQFCAVAVDNSPDAWRAFIREWNPRDWLHGYDYSFQINYRTQFDVLKTPTVYVLDKDRKIIARALPAEQVADFIAFQRKQKGM